jgi:hypothetical protein
MAVGDWEAGVLQIPLNRGVQRQLARFSMYAWGGQSFLPWAELRPPAILSIRGIDHERRAVSANKALPPRLGMWVIANEMLGVNFA